MDIISDERIRIYWDDHCCCCTISLFFYHFTPLIYSILVGLTSSIIIPYFINNTLGGHNGDSYGAGLVITETANLLLLGIILVPN